MEDGDAVTYSVESPDFSEDGTSLPIGRVKLDKVRKSFEFWPDGELLDKQVIPPYVYELSEAERLHLLRSKYHGYQYGGWTSRIARVARRLLNEGVYPSSAYGVT